MNQENINKGQAVEIMACPFLLLPEKAMYWPEKEMLILSDPHLGKVTHFRKAGIGVPLEAKNENWRNLNDLIAIHSPRSVYILGDLFHSTYNKEWQELEEFMSVFDKVEFHLVLGNHDILDDEVYQNSRLIISDRCIHDQFVFTHHPLEEPEGDLFNLCGHIHPSVMLSGKGRQRIKLPCFYFLEHQMILPAFGVFTGTMNLEIEKATSIYGLAEGQILKIK